MLLTHATGYNKVVSRPYLTEYPDPDRVARARVSATETFPFYWKPETSIVRARFDCYLGIRIGWRAATGHHLHAPLTPIPRVRDKMAHTLGIFRYGSCLLGYRWLVSRFLENDVIRLRGCWDRKFSRKIRNVLGKWLLIKMKNIFNKGNRDKLRYTVYLIV